MSEDRPFEGSVSRLFTVAPDIEAKAIVTCVEALDCLADEPRRRVLGYLDKRYGGPHPLPEITSTVTEPQCAASSAITRAKLFAVRSAAAHCPLAPTPTSACDVVRRSSAGPAWRHGRTTTTRAGALRPTAPGRPPGEDQHCCPHGRRVLSRLRHPVALRPVAVVLPLRPPGRERRHHHTQRHGRIVTVPLSDRFDLQVTRDALPGPDGPNTVAGSTQATLTGLNRHRDRVTVVLTEAEYEAIRTADVPDHAAHKVIDEAPAERITSSVAAWNVWDEGVDTNAVDYTPYLDREPGDF